MPDPKINLLEITRGCVEAPAGCGKTQLIAAALTHHCGPKPILVLTHTNAGVAALRQRLGKAGVPQARYRISTLDGWALRLLATFPVRSAISPQHLELANPGVDYPAIRRAAVALLQDRHIDDILCASYAHLIVDEYQDCGAQQHAMVTHMSAILPTVVLGDPMQEIFGWQGAHPDWAGEVCQKFPIAVQLSTPWRWINAGYPALGDWLLSARKDLKSGKKIDLQLAPTEVQWIPLDGTDDDAKQRAACMTRSPRQGGEVLIMTGGVEKAAQRRFARLTPGAVTVEAVDISELTSFARAIEIGTAGNLTSALEFASEVITGVDRAGILARVQTLLSGTQRKPAERWEQAAVDFDATGSAKGLVELFMALEQVQGARTFRPEILAPCIKALQVVGPATTFLDAVVRIREQARIIGRRMPTKAVGSPLLLKGLEADVAIILNASALDRNNLYVAMTRGSSRLVICSASSNVG